MKHIHKKSAAALPKILYFSLLLCLLLGVAAADAQGQQTDFSSVERSFGQYREKVLQEKLFLHLDKPVYVCGETMWFKVYNLDGTLHKPLDMSKVAYVEVLDEAKRPVLQGKIPLKEGTGKGSFVLPLSLGSGNYTVRSYTSWMKNFSPDFYFEQTVTIVNTTQNAGLTAAAPTAAYDIQFFPEGGNLVDGLATKVAYKAADPNTGKGVECEGEILDQDGNIITSFVPVKFGIGHFTFTPSRTATYTVQVRFAGKQEVVRKQLPAIREQGYVLQVEDANASEVRITVSSTGQQAEQVYLLGHARQQIAIAEAGAVQNGTLSFLVRKEAMADGINHFTLFNSQKRPVCERLYFKRPESQLAIAAQAGKGSYGTREQVTLDIATTAAGEATPADLSLAVYRLDALQPVEAPLIGSYLLLSSDLKGTIENPEYYLSATGAEADQALDNLMLTHGWSRFRWEEVLSPQPVVFEFQPEINGHVIRGKVTHATTGAAAPNITTFLGAPGKHVRFYMSTSAANGNFKHEVKDFYGYKEIVLQTNTLKDSTYYFRVYSPFSDKFSAANMPLHHLRKEVQHDLTQRHVEAQVQSAYFEKYRDVYFSPGVDSTAFYGEPDDRYLLDDYVRFKNLEEVLHEYVTPVQARKRRDGYHLMLLDRPNRGVFTDNPLVLLDGVPVFNMNRVMEIDPLKVKKLEVVTQKYFFGPRTYSGILSLSTYQGDLGGFNLDPRALLLEYDGLQLEREFYAPTYDAPLHVTSRLPDYRNTLHWAPAVVTKADGTGKVTFFTSDQAGTYLVVVQGVTGKGLAGSKTFKFEVKEAL